MSKQPSKIPLSKTMKFGGNNISKTTPTNSKPKSSFLPRPKELLKSTIKSNTKAVILKPLKANAGLSLGDKIHSDAPIPIKTLDSIPVAVKEIRTTQVMQSTGPESGHGHGESASVRIPLCNTIIPKTFEDCTLSETMENVKKASETCVAIDFLMAPKSTSDLGDCLSKSPFEVPRKESTVIETVIVEKIANVTQSSILSHLPDDETFYGGGPKLVRKEKPSSKMQVRFADEIVSIEEISPPLELHNVVSDPKMGDDLFHINNITEIKQLESIENELRPSLVESTEEMAKTPASLYTVTETKEIVLDFDEGESKIGNYSSCPLESFESIENVKCPSLVESTEDIPKAKSIEIKNNLDLDNLQESIKNLKKLQVVEPVEHLVSVSKLLIALKSISQTNIPTTSIFPENAQKEEINSKPDFTSKMSGNGISFTKITNEIINETGEHDKKKSFRKIRKSRKSNKSKSTVVAPKEVDRESEPKNGSLENKNFPSEIGNKSDVSIKENIQLIEKELIPFMEEQGLRTVSSFSVPDKAEKIKREDTLDSIIGQNENLEDENMEVDVPKMIKMYSHLQPLIYISEFEIRNPFVEPRLYKIKSSNESRYEIRSVMGYIPGSSKAKITIQAILMSSEEKVEVFDDNFAVLIATDSPNSLLSDEEVQDYWAFIEDSRPEIISHYKIETIILEDTFLDELLAEEKMLEDQTLYPVTQLRKYSSSSNNNNNFARNGKESTLDKSLEDHILFSKSAAQMEQDLKEISKGLEEVATWGSVTLYLSSIAIFAAVVLRNLDEFMQTPAPEPEPMGWIGWLTSFVSSK